ncbi:MAG: hypothetical protein LC117_01030 [Bacteroidia bacterium]|nr:hypothetical protein [Bacteroidia bacterium]MCZ2276501.1 hypothetical protein [Bacteroidia bacterium]
MRKQILDRWIYAFAFQLVVMHLKKNQVLMAYWLILFGFTGGWLANKFGIQYLFLDPEYMGQVGPKSFLIMGLATGAFIMAFNISGFILNSFRFPFLASLSKTFQKWVLNNFIIPSSFLLFYIICIFRFQYYNQLIAPSEIILNISFFLLGVAVIVYSTWKYFLITNKDIYKLFGVEDSEKKAYSDNSTFGKRRKGKDTRQWRVETYLTIPLKTNLVRDTSHYKPYMLQSVLKQNHINAAVVELLIFLLFIGLGIFRDYELFRIPAGASILLLFTVIIMLSGVFRYWLRAWANTAIVVVFLLLNYLSQFDFINPSNKAYGLNYRKEKPVYSIPEIEKFYTDEVFDQDKAQTLAILEKWKISNQQPGGAKPKMILMSISGGGIRSTLFSFSVMMAIDSISNGKLMPLTTLITGSSGGLIGAAYYRSLYLENGQKSFARNPEATQYRKNTAKDILNAVSFSFVVNDLFLNLQTFSDSTGRYVKDRAYAFEQQLIENTNSLLDRSMSDFSYPEAQAMIPMMVISPTIINDGRVFLISSTPVSYLLQHYSVTNNKFKAIPDGIELNHFFANQHPGELRLTSALRLNATFPYVLPAASLPTNPPVEVMDAGIRDNYGIVNSVRFLYCFRDWIAENTSGVILLQIRDIYKRSPVDFSATNTFWSKLTSPLKNATGNFILMQDYQNDELLIQTQAWFKGNLKFILFEMPKTEEKVSLSLHLTNKEKNYVLDCAYNEANKKSYQEIRKELVP